MVLFYLTSKCTLAHEFAWLKRHERKPGMHQWRLLKFSKVNLLPKIFIWVGLGGGGVLGHLCDALPRMQKITPHATRNNFLEWQPCYSSAEGFSKTLP